MTLPADYHERPVNSIGRTIVTVDELRAMEPHELRAWEHPNGALIGSRYNSSPVRWWIVLAPELSLITYVPTNWIW